MLVWEIANFCVHQSHSKSFRSRRYFETPIDVYLYVSFLFILSLSFWFL